MSDSYAQYVPAVSTQLNNVPQQMQSVLQGAVTYDSNYTDPGTAFFLDDRGTTDPKERQQKGGRIEPRELQGFRRGGYFAGDEDWFYVYEEDKVRMLLDPTNTDMMSLVAGKERKKDYDIINGALFGTTMSSSGTAANAPLDTANAFPSAQIIAVNDRTDLTDEEKAKVATGTGPVHLTIGKLITASKMLKRSHVRGKMYIAVDENGKANLLSSTSVTSQWYNDVKALVNGEVNTFMGFTFLELSSLDGMIPTYTASSLPANKYPAWVDSAVYYRERPITSVSVQKDITIKGHPVQVYYARERAYARRYDTGVVQILCTRDRQLA